MKAKMRDDGPRNQSEEKKDHHYIHNLAASHSGYLQAVDTDGLFQIAKKNDYLIHLATAAGTICYYRQHTC